MSGFLANIWDFLWMFLTIFIFIAWLMALFSIISDVFRDPDLNGGLKAVWLVALIFVPVLTAIIYLIVRGRGMGDRAAAQANRQQSAAREYIREAAGTSPAEEITRAKALLDSGTISETEYLTLKAKALD